MSNRLKGFEKVLGRNFCCLDCKYHWSNLPYLDPSACINEETCEELQLIDEIIAEIKTNMNGADDNNNNIHPKYNISHTFYPIKNSKKKYFEYNIYL